MRDGNQGCDGDFRMHTRSSCYEKGTGRFREALGAGKLKDANARFVDTRVVQDNTGHQRKRPECTSFICCPLSPTAQVDSLRDKSRA